MAFALATILLLTVIAWGLILPRLVRRDVRQRLERYWGGVVEFGDTSFSLRGPIVIQDVALKDDAGRTWARTPSLVADVSHWDWLDPQITALRASQMEVTYHLDAAAPLRQPTDTGEPAWPFLTLISVELNRVAFLDDGQTIGQIGPSEIVATWRDDDTGLWDATLKGAAPSMPVDIQMTVDVDVVDHQELLAANIAGDLAGGQVTATIRSRLSADRPLEAWGSVAASGVELAAVPMIPPSQVGRGRLVQGHLTFYVDQPSPSALLGEGTFFAKDLPAKNVPLLHEIAVVVGPNGHLEETDLAMAFSMAGEMLTVEQGHVGGAVLAVSIEPGSTANLRTGELDMIATAALLRDLRGMVRHLPIVGMLAGLSEAMTHMTVTGTWQRPLVTPVPLADTSEPLLDFFSRLDRSGGQLDEGVLGAMITLLGDSDGPADNGNWPEAAPPPPIQPPMPPRPRR